MYAIIYVSLCIINTYLSNTFFAYIKPDLKEHINLCKNQCLNDLELGHGLVNLPDALSKKYPNASKKSSISHITLTSPYCFLDYLESVFDSKALIQTFG